MIKTVLALSCCVLLTGCAHKNTIVGKWAGTVTNPMFLSDPPGAPENIMAEFSADGTVTWVVGTPPRTIIFSYTYTVKGDTLTQISKSVALNGHVFIPYYHDGGVTTMDTIHFDGDTLTMTRQRTETGAETKEALGT